MAASKNHTVLAPSTPDSSPIAGASGSQFRFDEKRNISDTDFESDDTDDLRGRSIVAKFGDRNCGITHYFDFGKEDDSFQRIITNAKFYLQQAGNQFESKFDSLSNGFTIFGKTGHKLVCLKLL